LFIRTHYKKFPPRKHAAYITIVLPLHHAIVMEKEAELFEEVAEGAAHGGREGDQQDAFDR
jgi:hypothetical protein